MAVNVATLTARLEADTRDFKRGMDGARRDLSGLESATGRASTGIGGLGKAAAGLAGAFAAAKVGDFIFDVTQLAVDAEEAAAAFTTTFGPAVGDVAGFVEEFANKAGFAEFELQQMLAITGNVVQGLGATEQQSAELATSMATLAGDVASFSNASGGASAVLGALQSAINGEREALKTYGLALSEAEVQQRAFLNTGKESADELTRLEKATATVELAYEKAGKAVGDLDRTAGSAANQQRELSALWKEAQVALGEAFLPVLESMIPVLKDLVGLLGPVATGISAMRDALFGVDTLGVAVNEAFEDLAESVAANEDPLREVAFLLELGARQGSLNEEQVRRWASEYGVADQTLRDAAGALMENTGLMSEFGGSAQDALRDIAGLDEAVASADKTLRNFQIPIEDNRLAAAGFTTELDITGRTIETTEQTMRRAEKAGEDFAAAQEEAARQLDAERRVAETTREAIKSMADAQRRAVNPAFNLFRASEDLARSQEKVNKMVAEGTILSDDGKAALIDLAGAQADMNVATAEFEQTSEPALVNLDKLLTDAGVAEENIAGLRDELEKYAGMDIARKTVGIDLDFNVRGLSAAVQRLLAAGMGRVHARDDGGFNVSFDDGGVVPGPRGKARWILAHGGETVLPTHKAGGGVAPANVVSGMGGGVNLTVVGDPPPAWLSRTRRELLAIARRNGDIFG